MASITIPNPNFVLGTTADPDKVDANFEAIRLFIQGQVVHKDGANAFTGYPLLPAAAPTQSTHPVRKQDLDAVIADLNVRTVDRVRATGAPGVFIHFGVGTTSTDASGNGLVNMGVVLPAVPTVVLANTAADPARPITTHNPSTTTFNVYSTPGVTFGLVYCAFYRVTWPPYLLDESPPF